MPHGLKTSSTATCRSERRPRWPSCKGKKPHDQASADQVQEAVTLRSVAAFPFWSIFVDEFRASLRLFWRQHACALRPCQSRADLIRQQFGANVGIGSCVPPQPEYPIVSKTSKPSITLGFRDSKFLSTPGQRFASPPSRGQTIVAIGVTAPAHNACCGRHHRLSAAARGPAVPRCHGSPCPVSTWQSPPTSMMSSCLRTRREGGSVP